MDAVGEAPAGFRVVRGTPTAEELAALVTVLATRAAPAAVPAPTASSPWRDHARRLGVTRPGPHAWSGSARPC